MKPVPGEGRGCFWEEGVGEDTHTKHICNFAKIYTLHTSHKLKNLDYDNSMNMQVV